MPRADTTVATLPCQWGDSELFFSEHPRDLERAKDLCAACPLRQECLDGALQRREPWGVWGGQILVAGEIVAAKRGRGRPRKNAA
ncbi:MAG: WhiB family transcriptional regulator [Brachybacterium sp.]|nr:WhiB family transcriptional regulator [Brachybacterium sp.]